MLIIDKTIAEKVMNSPEKTNKQNIDFFLLQSGIYLLFCKGHLS